MSQTKTWYYTINNHGEENLVSLRKLVDENKATYHIFQQEIGEEEGTPHIQGFIILPRKTRLNGVKKLVGDRAHLTVFKGPPQRGRNYCSKEETRMEGTSTEEFGEIPETQGNRNDLDSFKEAVRNGTRKLQALEEHSEIMAKYPRFAREYMDLHRPRAEIPDHDLRPWQARLKEELSHPPNDREIIFVNDPTGNQGKTWFARKYCQDNPETAQFLEPGKKADMAYAINEETTHCFVNVTRQKVESLQYSFLEALKDGLVFSPKYESGMKYLQPMHVIVMMNCEPDLTLLSSDRYKIYELNE